MRERNQKNVISGSQVYSVAQATYAAGWPLEAVQTACGPECTGVPVNWQLKSEVMIKSLQPVDDPPVLLCSHNVQS